MGYEHFATRDIHKGGLYGSSHRSRVEGIRRGGCCVIPIFTDDPFHLRRQDKEVPMCELS